MKDSKDKLQAIESVKRELARHRRRLEECSRQHAPYGYDIGPDRDQYNFLHGMVCAYREMLMCFGIAPKDIPNEIEKVSG